MCTLSNAQQIYFVDCTLEPRVNRVLQRVLEFRIILQHCLRLARATLYTGILRLCSQVSSS